MDSHIQMPRQTDRVNNIFQATKQITILKDNSQKILQHKPLEPPTRP